MHILIFGAGAVGGYFGARIIESGAAKVTFLARGETLAKLKTEGLTVVDSKGTRILPVDAVGSIEEINDSVDVVLLATKITAEGQELPEVPRDAMVVLTQNSVEMPQLAAERYGKSRVIPGVVRSFLIHEGPGRMRYSGGVLAFSFGAVIPSQDGVVTELQSVLDAAGITTQVLEDILVDVWTKAMFVTCFGGLGALYRCPLGELRTTYRSDLEALMREVEVTARANGVSLPEDVVATTMAFADDQPALATSSMQRDIYESKPSELDAQVGAIVRMAERGGTNAPLHRMILHALSRSSVFSLGGEN